MKNLIRILFGGLLLFYSLNLLHILQVPLAFSWIGLIVTVSGVWLLLEKFHFPDWIWLLSFVMIALDSYSDIFQLYSQMENWDRLMHFIGGIFLTFPLFVLIASFQKVRNLKLSKTFLLIILLSFIGLLGILYEALEYGIDRFYFGYSKALGDGNDTVEDLLLNLTGGLCGYLISSVFLYWNNAVLFHRTKSWIH